MKSLLSKTKFLTLTLGLLIGISAYAQREITGTVYKDGKPAAGVTVTAHHSDDMFMTSFDGKYKIKADKKTKYLKFTFIDDTRKLDIQGNESNHIDFSFDGKIPAKTSGTAGNGAVDLRSMKELVQAKVTDFMSDYTIYDQFYKQKDYKSALDPWYKVYHKYPKSTINLYIQGANIYRGLIAQTSDWTKKDAYIDSLMSMYDQRVKYFGEKGFVYAHKGTDYLTYKLQNESLTEDQVKTILKKGYDILGQAIDLQKEDADVAGLVVYMQATKRLFTMGELPQDKVAVNYQKVSKIIDSGLAKAPDDPKYKKAKELVDNLFQTSGAADCKSLIALYEPQFDQISKDEDALKKMLRVLEHQDCTESDLFAKASEKLYDMDPSPEAAFNMARLFVKNNQFAKAKEFYKHAIDGETDKVLQAKYYYELALYTYAKEKNYQEAHDYLKKAIADNPKSGRAYILMGDIYAQYSKNYGKNDFEHKTLYWLAVDYYNKAKRADPDVFTTANQKINLYSQYFPDKESLFFQGFQIGQPYKIGSWINESTKIRAK